MQMPGTANPLDQLKDIHTPDAIGLWPPAIGWYLIAAFLVAALVLVGVILWRRWQQNAYRRAALRECDDIEREITANPDYRTAAIRIATLLKRTALSVSLVRRLRPYPGTHGYCFSSRKRARHAFPLPQANSSSKQFSRKPARQPGDVAVAR